MPASSVTAVKVSVFMSNSFLFTCPKPISANPFVHALFPILGARSQSKTLGGAGRTGQLVETGPNPLCHGLVRWRRVDLRDELDDGSVWCCTNLSFSCPTVTAAASALAWLGTALAPHGGSGQDACDAKILSARGALCIS